MINAWWAANRALGRASVLFAYAIGKAQRLLAGVDPSIGPIIVHGAVARFLPAYEAAGVRLAPAEHGDSDRIRRERGRALVIAPPSAVGSPWLRKLGEVSTAFASGWMQIRGTRRRRNLDRGFVLSDHADWNDLLETIRESGAETVGVTHGYAHVLARWLEEQGKTARVVATHFEGESAED